MVRTWCAFHILSSRCALCQNGHNSVHFLDLSASKSSPKMRRFSHVHFEMCLAPQRRALFQDLNFQKCSDTVVFLPFWLGNVLLATAACAFSTSQLPKVHPHWCVLPFYVQMCFVPRRRAFRPSRATNHKTLEKHSVSRRLFYLPRTLIFFLLALSLLWLTALGSPLCFSICPYCQKFDFN